MSEFLGNRTIHLLSKASRIESKQDSPRRRFSIQAVRRDLKDAKAQILKEAKTKFLEVQNNTDAFDSENTFSSKDVYMMIEIIREQDENITALEDEVHLNQGRISNLDLKQKELNAYLAEYKKYAPEVDAIIKIKFGANGISNKASSPNWKKLASISSPQLLKRAASISVQEDSNDTTEKRKSYDEENIEDVLFDLEDKVSRARESRWSFMVACLTYKSRMKAIVRDFQELQRNSQVVRVHLSGEDPQDSNLLGPMDSARELSCSSSGDHHSGRKTDFPRSGGVLPVLGVQGRTTASIVELEMAIHDRDKYAKQVQMLLNKKPPATNAALEEQLDEMGRLIGWLIQCFVVIDGQSYGDGSRGGARWTQKELTLLRSCWTDLCQRKHIIDPVSKMDIEAICDSIEKFGTCMIRAPANEEDKLRRTHPITPLSHLRSPSPPSTPRLVESLPALPRKFSNNSPRSSIVERSRMGSPSRWARTPGTNSPKRTPSPERRYEIAADVYGLPRKMSPNSQRRKVYNKPLVPMLQMRRMKLPY